MEGRKKGGRGGRRNEGKEGERREKGRERGAEERRKKRRRDEGKRNGWRENKLCLVLFQAPTQLFFTCAFLYCKRWVEPKKVGGA